MAARLRLMDRAGVQVQVLSACPQSPYGENADQAADAARFVNDQYAALAGRYPDRFAAFAALRCRTWTSPSVRCAGLWTSWAWPGSR
jgi:predicted TIM-barrel fold metal-dependent hydrolase